MADGSPPVRRLQLGREMRRLREAAEISRDQAAAELECDVSKISKVETGKQTIQAAEVRALLDLYGVPADARDDVLRLAREARKRSAYRVPDWARTYVGLEADAAEIRTYEAELVPGLLQTEGYTRAVIRAASPTLNPAEVDRIVAVRAERQSRLHGDRPPQLWAVINEAVIRRPVGGPDVMAEQLQRLRELADLPTVSLQVLPFSVGEHPVMGSSFVLLRLADPPDAQVVYLEDLSSADYLDQPGHIAGYTMRFDQLAASALDTTASADMIDKAMDR
jgi:transcriptional regulator with XRE-family HTH domain